VEKKRIPDPTLMARLQLSVKGVDWAASLVKPWQHQHLEGAWSPHENVFHLIANERIFQERIARALKEERPTFERWDSLGHMAKHYSTEPGIEQLADQFMEARTETYETFRALTPGQWARTATWPDRRIIDLAWLGEKVLWHALDHFAGLLDLHGEFEPRQAGGD
jgi:DinB superfamily